MEILLSKARQCLETMQFVQKYSGIHCSVANLGRLLDCRVVIDGGDAAATDFLDDMAQSVVSRRGLHGEVRVEALRGNGGHCFGLQPKVHYAFDAGDEIVVPRMNSYSDFNATR